MGKDKALSELHSVLQAPLSTKAYSTEEVEQRLRKLKADTYKYSPPQEYGLRVWWVMHFDKDGKDKYDDPYLTEGDAERNLTTYHNQGIEADIFELRNITSKSKAKGIIKDILKARKLQQEIRQRGNG